MKSISCASAVLACITGAVAATPHFHEARDLKITAPATSFLGLADSECACSFDRGSSCGCDATLEFMNCIAQACDNPKCDCQGTAHFLGACRQIGGECPHSGLQCFGDHAKCLVPTAAEEIAGEERREDMFGAEPVMSTGAEAQQMPKLRAEEEKVEKLEEELSKEEAVEREKKEAEKEEPKEKAGADGAAPSHHSSSAMWGAAGNPKDWLALAAIQLVIICVAALMYNRLRLGNPFPQAASVANRPTAGGFKYSLFSCHQDPKLSLFALACPCLRWADTLEKANEKPLLKYYVAAALFTALVLLDPLTAGASLLVLVLVATYFRQKLRAEFSLQDGGRTIWEDFLAYFCCFCCAVVQEARQVETGRTDAC